MAEIILEPTVQSKVIPLSIRLNDTDASLVSQLVTNRQFSTADTDAWFSFTLEGLAATTGTFDLTLINLHDKSVFNHTDKVFNTNPFYYKLDSGTDELTNEIRHAGKWVGQLVVTLANGDSATRKFIFGIEGHILDGTVVQTILLEDYNALIASIESAKDELTQYNIDYASLIGTVTDQEAARSDAEELRVIADALRETKEGVRQTTFEANEVIRDGVVDSAIEGEMIAQTVATKLAEKEATFAPRMLSLESELADIKQDVSLTVTVGTGGDYATVNEAIAALSQKKLKYSNTGFNATINLLTGFVMVEQIFVKNIDLGFITITSADAEVIVNATGFVNNVNELGYGATGLTLTTGAVITGYGNAVLPVIDVLFNLNNSGTLGRTFGLVLIYGATGRIARDKGFINGIAGGVAIYEGSRLYATDTIIRNNAGNNIACYRGSYILVRGSDISGSGGYGVYLDNLCQMDAAMANFSNSADAAIWASAGTVVSANSANLSGSRIGVTADSSSVVDVHGSNIDNCTQTGVSCSGSLVDVRNSSILNSGGVAVSCTMGGTINADTVDCTGAISYCLSATYGGTINARNAKAQKVLGTNGLDIRILSGAIINANGATGGITGTTANKLSGAGIVFTSAAAAADIGFTGTYAGRGHWFTNLGMSVSTTLPLEKPTLKNIVVTVVNILQTGNLTTEELALITIEKNSEGFSLITSNATLAAKMDGKNTKVTATITAI